jgi:hypothetical protein
MNQPLYYWCSGACTIVHFEEKDKGDVWVKYDPISDSKHQHSCWANGEQAKQLRQLCDTGQVVALGGAATDIPDEEGKYYHRVKWIATGQTLPDWHPVKGNKTPATADGYPVRPLTRDEQIARHVAIKAAAELISYQWIRESGDHDVAGGAVIKLADRFLDWLTRPSGNIMPMPDETEQPEEGAPPPAIEPPKASTPPADNGAAKDNNSYRKYSRKFIAATSMEMLVRFGTELGADKAVGEATRTVLRAEYGDAQERIAKNSKQTAGAPR